MKVKIPMFNNQINIIDQRLEEMIKGYKELYPFLQYSLFPGGKRLRPLLVLTILEDLGLDPNIGLDTACAIEFIHTYSLIHDDLPAMDNDDMRRNKLTLHLAHGEGNAILSGDALLTEAFYWLANLTLPDDKKIKIILMISKYSGANGMIKGQYLDIQNKSIDIKDIEEIHIHKTTDLISCAFESAAIISDKNQEDFHEIAVVFGKAFQIKDDLDDIDKNEDTSIVKTIGIDAANQKFIEYRSKSLELIDKLIGNSLTYKLVETIL